MHLTQFIHLILAKYKNFSTAIKQLHKLFQYKKNKQKFDKGKKYIMQQKVQCLHSTHTGVQRQHIKCKVLSISKCVCVCGQSAREVDLAWRWGFASISPLKNKASVCTCLWICHCGDDEQKLVIMTSICCCRQRRVLHLMGTDITWVQTLIFKNRFRHGSSADGANNVKCVASNSCM